MKSSYCSANMNHWMCGGALDFLKNLQLRLAVIFDFKVMSIYKFVESFAYKQKFLKISNSAHLE